MRTFLPSFRRKPGSSWALIKKIPAFAGMTALVLYASLALASTYKPGSVGYLYDSCVAALKDSQTADAFDATYCGGFVEGYVTGVAATNIHLPPPSPDDPCAAKKNHRIRAA